MSRPQRIAVIGAGVAGLACARELRLRGAEVAVFDKGRGPGGRTSTRRDDDRTFDHGAQYFGAEGDEFRAVVADLEARGAVAEWTGRFVELANGRQRALPAKRRLVGVPGMNELTRALGEGLDVRYSTKVTTIEAAPRAVTLADDDGSFLGEWDRVALAVPAPQAVELLARASDAAGEASELAAVAGAAELAPCWAALAYLERPPAVDFVGAKIAARPDSRAPDDHPASWIGRNTSKPGRPPGEAWVVHASPTYSAAFLESTADDVARTLGAELSRWVGAEPNRVVAHRWRYALVARAAGRPCASAGRLGLCGDYMLGPRLEHAFDSGAALGRTLAQAH